MAKPSSSGFENILTTEPLWSLITSPIDLGYLNNNASTIIINLFTETSHENAF